MNHVDTIIVSQAPDMTHAISNDVSGRDDLAYHAGAGGLALALACLSASTADLMRRNMCIFWKK